MTSTLDECRLLNAQELMVYLHKHRPSRSPTKKSNGVKSHDLGGQLISPWREITQPGNVSFNKAKFARVVWHVAPSSWNHIFSKSHSSISGKTKVSYHMAITLRIDGDSRSIGVFEEVRINRTFGPKSTPNSDIFWMYWLLFNYLGFWESSDNFVY